MPTQPKSIPRQTLQTFIASIIRTVKAIPVMEITDNLRVRRSITDLLVDHDSQKPEELDKLIRAWAGIQALPPDDGNSFFKIAGYHGEPFRGAGWGNADWWGKYCNHGNVLFPTWHRAYLLRIEDALRSIRGCEDMLRGHTGTKLV